MGRLSSFSPRNLRNVLSGATDDRSYHSALHSCRPKISDRLNLAIRILAVQVGLVFGHPDSLVSATPKYVPYALPGNAERISYFLLADALRSQNEYCFHLRPLQGVLMAVLIYLVCGIFGISADKQMIWVHA